MEPGDTLNYNSSNLVNSSYEEADRTETKGMLWVADHLTIPGNNLF